jgi:hypothetical protein
MWFNLFRGGRFDAVAANRGVVVEKVHLPFEDAECPTDGVEVTVWLDRNLVCATKEEIEREARHRAEARAEENRIYLASLNALREEAETFNATLMLPFAWGVGQKDVLSGLASDSAGDGRRANTVNHVLLHEDVALGRLNRRKGDFLCTSHGGSNGKRWAGRDAVAIDGSNKPYPPKIDCKKCLELARKWVVTQEVVSPVAQTGNPSMAPSGPETPSSLFSVELVCGSSKVHADEWDGTEINHPKHVEVHHWAESVGLTCDLSGTSDQGEQFSDAYIRFPASRVAEVIKGLAEAGWDGDIVDVFDGRPSDEEIHAVRLAADAAGWDLGRGFEREAKLRALPTPKTMDAAIGPQR